MMETKLFTLLLRSKAEKHTKNYKVRRLGHLLQFMFNTDIQFLKNVEGGERFLGDTYPTISMLYCYHCKVNVEVMGTFKKQIE